MSDTPNPVTSPPDIEVTVDTDADVTNNSKDEKPKDATHNAAPPSDSTKKKASGPGAGILMAYFCIGFVLIAGGVLAVLVFIVKIFDKDDDDGPARPSGGAAAGKLEMEQGRRRNLGRSSSSSSDSVVTYEFSEKIDVSGNSENSLDDINLNLNENFISPHRRLDMTYRLKNDNPLETGLSNIVNATYDATTLCVTIVYARAVEATSYKCLPYPRSLQEGYDCATQFSQPEQSAAKAECESEETRWNNCKTFGAKVGGMGQPTAGALGSCVEKDDQNNERCKGEVIYENPGCCVTPGTDIPGESIDKCTTSPKTRCSSECDLWRNDGPLTGDTDGPDNAPPGDDDASGDANDPNNICKLWPNNVPTIARGSNSALDYCIDLTKSSAEVNAALGAKIMPILYKENDGLKWIEAGGKFRGVRMNFGGSNMPTTDIGQPSNPQATKLKKVDLTAIPTTARNFRIQCPGLSSTKDMFYPFSDAEYYLPNDNAISVLEGDSLQFSIEYNNENLCKAYRDWTIIGRDCLQCDVNGDGSNIVECDGNVNQGNCGGNVKPTGICRTCIDNCHDTPWNYKLKDHPMCKLRAIGCFEGETGDHVFAQTGHIICLKPHELQLKPQITKVLATTTTAP